MKVAGEESNRPVSGRIASSSSKLWETVTSSGAAVLEKKKKLRKKSLMDQQLPWMFIKKQRSKGLLGQAGEVINK